MTYKEAHDWCLQNEAIIYFHIHQERILREYMIFLTKQERAKIYARLYINNRTLGNYLKAAKDQELELDEAELVWESIDIVYDLCAIFPKEDKEVVEDSCAADDKYEKWIYAGKKKKK